jgi:hypothetical protein
MHLLVQPTSYPSLSLNYVSAKHNFHTNVGSGACSYAGKLLLLETFSIASIKKKNTGA